MASATPPAKPRQAAARRTRLDRRWEAVPLKALADPTRASLLRCLIKCGRPCSVSEVSGCCEVDFSVVARHLAALAAAGVLEADKRGRTVWYRARTAALASSLRGLADAMDDWRATGRDATAGGRACGCAPPPDACDEHHAPDTNRKDTTENERCD